MRRKLRGAAVRCVRAGVCAGLLAALLALVSAPLAAQTTPAGEPSVTVLPIPDSAVVEPGATVQFVGSLPLSRPGDPVNPAGPASAEVRNASGQLATVSYDGGQLTVSVPSGWRIQLLEGTTVRCTPENDEGSRVDCATPGRPPALVIFSTVSVAESEVLPLAVGCSNITLTWPTGTALETVARAVTPMGAVESIWRLEAATGTFRGWSSLAMAPNDLSTVARLDPVFICMRMRGQLTRPAI